MTTTLSNRECQVLVELAMNGGSNEELGRRLGCAPATVRTHVQNILSKTGVHSKTDLVVAFWVALTRS